MPVGRFHNPTRDLIVLHVHHLFLREDRVLATPGFPSSRMYIKAELHDSRERFFLYLSYINSPFPGAQRHYNALHYQGGPADRCGMPFLGRGALSSTGGKALPSTACGSGGVPGVCCGETGLPQSCPEGSWEALGPSFVSISLVRLDVSLPVCMCGGKFSLPRCAHLLLAAVVIASSLP